MLIFTTNVYAWSSADNLHDAFATHQFLNKKAYQAIREHPAFNSSGFPSLDDIQRHGSVTITKKGVVGLAIDLIDYDPKFQNIFSKSHIFL